MMLSSFLLFIILNKTATSQSHIIKFGDERYMVSLTPSDSSNRNFKPYTFNQGWKLKDSLPDGVWIVLIEDPFNKRLFKKSHKYLIVSSYCNGKRNGLSYYYYSQSPGNAINGIEYYINGNLVKAQFFMLMDSYEDYALANEIKYEEYHFLNGKIEGVAIILIDLKEFLLYYENNICVKWELFELGNLIESGNGYPNLFNCFDFINP